MSAELVSTIAEIRGLVSLAREAGDPVGLVPTMGALHEGHLSLIRRSKQECARTVVTLFVNPTQFNDKGDLAKYPRDIGADLEACTREGVDWLFAPSTEEMYPEAPLTIVDVPALTKNLCGPYRPGHFQGVAAVCAKLLNIVPAHRAYFGEKDYQQLTVIRRMVFDLNVPVEIVGCPTVREPDGLALSSRNKRLSPDERLAAPVLYTALQGVQMVAQRGLRDAAQLVEFVRSVLAEEPQARVEYVELVDAHTLQPVEALDRECRMAVAVWIGDIRLIDNIALAP